MERIKQIQEQRSVLFLKLEQLKASKKQVLLLMKNLNAQLERAKNEKRLKDNEHTRLTNELLSLGDELRELQKITLK